VVYVKPVKLSSRIMTSMTAKLPSEDSFEMDIRDKLDHEGSSEFLWISDKTSKK
jgi:hypothetical protein